MEEDEDKGRELTRKTMQIFKYAKIGSNDQKKMHHSQKVLKRIIPGMIELGSYQIFLSSLKARTAESACVMYSNQHKLKVDGQSVLVRRFLYQTFRYPSYEKNITVKNTSCREDLCVNPYHIVVKEPELDGQTQKTLASPIKTDVPAKAPPSSKPFGKFKAKVQESWVTGQSRYLEKKLWEHQDNTTFKLKHNITPVKDHHDMLSKSLSKMKTANFYDNIPVHCKDGSFGTNKMLIYMCFPVMKTVDQCPDYTVFLPDYTIQEIGHMISDHLEEISEHSKEKVPRSSRSRDHILNRDKATGQAEEAADTPTTTLKSTTTPKKYAFRKTCDTCSQRFNHITSYAHHKCLYNGKQFSCKVCGEQRETQQDFNHHFSGIGGNRNRTGCIKELKEELSAYMFPVKSRRPSSPQTKETEENPTTATDQSPKVVKTSTTPTKKQPDFRFRKKCDKCEETFKRLVTYVYHKCLHDENKPKCRVCYKSLENHAQLILHGARAKGCFQKLKAEYSDFIKPIIRGPITPKLPPDDDSDTIDKKNVEDRKPEEKAGETLKKAYTCHRCNRRLISYKRLYHHQCYNASEKNCRICCKELTSTPSFMNHFKNSPCGEKLKRFHFEEEKKKKMKDEALKRTVKSNVKVDLFDVHVTKVNSPVKRKKGRSESSGGESKKKAKKRHIDGHLFLPDPKEIKIGTPEREYRDILTLPDWAGGHAAEIEIDNGEEDLPREYDNPAVTTAEDPSPDEEMPNTTTAVDLDASMEEMFRESEDLASTINIYSTVSVPEGSARNSRRQGDTDVTQSCLTCGSFFTYQEFLDHPSRCKGKYYCEPCDKQHTSNFALKQHNKKMHPEPVQQSIATDEANEQDEITIEKEIIRCPPCGARHFKSSEALRLHRIMAPSCRLAITKMEAGTTVARPTSSLTKVPPPVPVLHIPSSVKSEVKHDPSSSNIRGTAIKLESGPQIRKEFMDCLASDTDTDSRSSIQTDGDGNNSLSVAHEGSTVEPSPAVAAAAPAAVAAAAPVAVAEPIPGAEMDSTRLVSFNFTAPSNLGHKSTKRYFKDNQIDIVKLKMQQISAISNNVLIQVTEKDGLKIVSLDLKPPGSTRLPSNNN